MSEQPEVENGPPMQGGPACITGVARANGIDIAYRSVGNPANAAILFIQGVGGQIEPGTDKLTDLLVNRGFRVVTFDNRDIGHSTKFESAGPPNYQAIQAAAAGGKPLPLAYTIEDMAADALGLMHALSIERAHVVGGSLGGAIAQVLAATSGDRVLPLTLISTTTGNPELPYGPAAAGLAAEAPADVGTQLEREVEMARRLEGPAYRTDETSLRDKIAARLQRSNYPDGIARQGVAIAGDLRARDHAITAPTIILHGADDPLFPPDHARDLARNIKNAELRIVSGMGHDVPDALVSLAAEAIEAAVARSASCSN